MKFFFKWNKKFSLSLMYSKGVHVGKNISKTNRKSIFFIKNYRNNIPLMDLNFSIWILKIINTLIMDILFKKQKVFFFSNKHNHFLEMNLIKYNQIYLNNKNSWYGGFLTNYKSIFMNSKMFKDNKNLNNFKFLPSLIFIFSSNSDNWITNESNLLKIPNSMLITSTTNPEGVNYPIPCGSKTSDLIGFFIEILNFYLYKALYLEKLYILNK